MASLSTDGSGNRKIQFVCPLDGKRKTLYLGKISARIAESFRHFVGILVACRSAGQADATAIQWVASLSDEHAGKLASLGLIEPRIETVVPTLREFVQTFLETKRHVKKSTRRTSEVALNSALVVLGGDRHIDTIDERQAGMLASNLTSSGYSKAYASKCVQNMRSLFRLAVRLKMVSPFEFVKAGSQVNNSRKFFVEADTIYKLIDPMPRMALRRRNVAMGRGASS